MSISDEKCQFDEAMANDVVPSQYTTMATEEQTTHNDYYKELIGTSGAGSVSSLSLNDTAAIRTTTTVTTSNTDSTEEEKMISNSANVANNVQNNPMPADIAKNNNRFGKTNNNNNNNNNNSNMKSKRRRRKSSKQKTNSKPYKKSNWNFQKRGRNSLSRLVPYNTNQFLMEEHMPEINVDCNGRGRDSSFSYDSDNDKEEYFSKEFCNVYEKAKSDRLYDMSKMQLIQEYLQLEASYDQLSNSLLSKSLGKTNGQLENGVSSDISVLKRLTDRVQELTNENLELRRQMADIRNRDHRHHNKSSHHHHHHQHYNNKNVRKTENGLNYHPPSTEDSESDSSSDSSSNSSKSDSSSSSSSSSSGSGSNSSNSRSNSRSRSMS